CCASAPSGQVIAAEPASVLMKSRRLMRAPKSDGKHLSGVNRSIGSSSLCPLWITDMCSANGDVRFTPESDHESGHQQEFMSALPPKADMCGATRDVRFGPKADINRTTPPMSEQSKQGINL